MTHMRKYDKIIIGAGLYGLYAAERCGRRGEKVLVLEYDDSAFNRASYINQARVHMGYHYPRSYSTAIKSAGYFKRFNEDYGFSIFDKFTQVYATSSNFSWTNAEQFLKFCNGANIRCEEVSVTKYFKKGMCDGAYLTEEYTYDAKILKDFFLEKLKNYSSVDICYGIRIDEIESNGDSYIFSLNSQEEKFKAASSFVLNATYASVNQINRILGFKNFQIKYELCEIILTAVNNNLKNTGLTVMDGPFFSIMPFGKTGLHSLTSVTFTPHMSSNEALPHFKCQVKSNGYCSPYQLGNCNDCKAKPESAWPYMSKLAKKYMNNDLEFYYKNSLFSMKPILMASEIDDSRPTIVRVQNTEPIFVSVLSGKINTVYDLDEILDYGTN